MATLRHKFARGLLPLALAVAFHPAGAIDLSQAYRAALDNDSTIRAARAAANARRERLPQSRAQLLPQVSLSASRYRNILDQRQPNFLGQETENHQVYTSSSDVLQVRQPIFRMALWADYRQAQAIVDDANATLEKQEQELRSCFAWNAGWGSSRSRRRRSARVRARL